MQELTDMQRCQGQDQQDDHHRDYGLVLNRENQLTYLYSDQASEMVCRVKRHARHY